MNGARHKVREDIVVSALRELSDELYQRRVWVVGSATEVSSLNEAASALFNDSVESAIGKQPS